MKVLIYYDRKELKPTGGPAGYLYNLYQELVKEKVNYIDFLELEEKKENKIKKIYNKFPNKMKKFLKLILNEKKINKEFFGNIKREAPVDFNQYDIIHFHSARKMYSVKDSLKDYKGIVIFTTHTPKVSYKEIIDDNINQKKYLRNINKYDRWEIIDEYAFNRADFIIFPSQESEECYYNTWKKYSNIKEKNKDKYRYLPTGLVPIKIDRNKNEIRKELGIPQNAKVFCYVGRHNEVKGYDKLKEIGNEVLQEYEDVYFLIAGKEEPIKGIKNDRWIEIGWTNKPHELIKCSDAFILPNKETYFDLILLEVLSIGKAVVLTKTGGNKYFEKFKNEGLFYYEYDDINKAIQHLKTIISKSDEELNKIERNNNKIFDSNFRIDIFTNEYLKILKEIKNEFDNRKK